MSSPAPLTSFSPSFDLFAVAPGDGRIKIWDSTKGLLQTEFTDLAATTTASDVFGAMDTEPAGGHLSLDYTCMKWLQPGSKKKKRSAGSILILGTGSGDVLAVDVAVGQLKWKLSDCHPGGVSAVSFSRHHIYTAGVDGMVCKIDFTGGLLSKFRSSSKSISSLSISADGKILAAASAQIRIFSCSDNKKITKFAGHSVAVRCMIFSEDGRYVLSSAVGEKYVAIWKVDAGKKESACCILSMEHPAVFLDSKGSDAGSADSTGLCVLAISETGLCYFWYGTTIKELRQSNPTIISSSIEPSLSKNNKQTAIYAAKFQDIVRPATGSMLVAYGSLVKPSFEKLTVQCGIDVKLGASQEGVLLPRGQFNTSKQGQATQTKVTALDCANAEDAILPLPKLHGHDKKRKHSTPYSNADVDATMVDLVVPEKSKTFPSQKRDDLLKMDDDAICMEDMLKAGGILDNRDDHNTSPMDSTENTTIYSGGIPIDANMPIKKIRSYTSSMSPSDAYKLLQIFVTAWKTRSISSRYSLTWIYCILTNHGQFIISQDSSRAVLDVLQKMTKLKCASVQPLLKLSGCLRLITTQIDGAGENMIQPPANGHPDDSSEEDEADDDDVDELVYGEEHDSSQSESDNDNDNEHQL